MKATLSPRPDPTPAVEGVTPPAATPPAASLGARFIALVVLAAGVQLWINHHLGLSSQTPWVALGLGTVSGVLGAAAHLLDDGEKKGLAEALRAILRALLNGGLLTWLWGIALVGAMFVSSVMVIPEAGAHGTAVLHSVDGRPVRQRSLDEAVAPMVVFTSPFGRPFRLGVPGFLEETVTVYPLVGLKVTPERDLRRSPSVLFRPSREGVLALRSEGTFTVALKGAAGDEPLLPPQKGHDGAFLLGRAQPIPATSVALWRLELEGGGASSALLAQMVLAWSRPKVLAPLRPLAPEMVLVAEVRTPVGVVVSRALVTLSREPLTDSALVDITPTGN
jgi:hypothetical protein